MGNGNALGSTIPSSAWTKRAKSLMRFERLLLFLRSPAGRTNANCVAADHFLGLRDGWGQVSWDHLPPELADVLSIAGDALHDTVAAPEVAQNFGCTPEQLLDQLQRVRGGWHGV